MRFVTLGVLLLSTACCTAPVAGSTPEPPAPQSPDGGVASGLHLDLNGIKQPKAEAPAAPVAPRTDHPYKPDHMFPLSADVELGTVEPLADIIDAQVAQGFRVVMLDINTDGGDVSAGMDFIRRMDNVRARGVKVVCVVHKALSMGAYILESACDERVAIDGALLMFHHSHGNGKLDGNADDLEDKAAELRVIDTALATRVLRRIKISKKEYYERIHRRDWYLSTVEALAIGAIDRVIPDGTGLPPIAELQ